jgi:hypothetical protein
MVDQMAGDTYYKYHLLVQYRYLHTDSTNRTMSRTSRMGEIYVAQVPVTGT